MKVALITVEYNSPQHTKGLIENLFALNSELDVYVVVTGEKTNSVIGNNRVRVFEPGENLGYFGGIRYVIDHINPLEYDFVIVCNNDVEIENADFFDNLKRHKKGDYAVIAPAITTLNQVSQNPHRCGPPSRCDKVILKIYFAHYFVAKALLFLERVVSTRKKEKPEIFSREIFSAHGAFLILAQKYFKSGGIVENDFFLYAEEDTIAAFCFEKGLLIYLDKSLQVKHYESVSTGRGLNKAKWQFQKSANRYIKNKYPSIF